MNNNNNCSRCNSGGKFMNGLIWGALIGAGLVFLLGTKKGKKLLRYLTEEGLEGASALSDLIEEVEDEPLVIKPKVKTSTHATNGKAVHHELKNREQEEIEENSSALEKITSSSQSVVKNVGGHARRFFKGIPRRN